MLLRFVLAHWLVGEQRFHDDGADAHTGVQRAPGILKHRLHRGAVFAAFGAGEPAGIRAVETHDAFGGSFHLQHHAGGGGFAASRFAHQAVRLALLDLERNAIHRLDFAHQPAQQDAARDGEVLADILQLDNCVATAIAGRGGSIRHCLGHQRASWAASSGVKRQQVAMWRSPATTAGGNSSRHLSNT